MNSFFEIVVLAFAINAPIQIIITIGQWLLMARFLSPDDKTANTPDKTIGDVLSCLALTYITAYLFALFFWLFWPLDPDLILYNNRISIPAIMGEIIAIPFWLKRFGYIGKSKSIT